MAGKELMILSMEHTILSKYLYCFLISEPCLLKNDLEHDSYVHEK